METIWRNDSDICGSFERQKKLGEKTDIFPEENFAVLVAVSLTENKCASFSRSVKWQTNLGDGGDVHNNSSRLTIQE